MAEKAVAMTTQFLSFTLADEVFGVAVSKTREVLEYIPVTKVPQCPAYMQGVINVRGSVVPVIDMRQKFGIAETERTVSTCIILIEVDLDGAEGVIGCLVDSVHEVLELAPEQIEPAPGIGSRWKTECCNIEASPWVLK